MLKNQVRQIVQDQDINMAKTNEYLYGKDVEVPLLDSEVVMRRIALLEDHLEELYKPHYSKRDEDRIRSVTKAADYWRDMQKENC